MTPRTLRAYIKPLPEYLNKTRAMETALREGTGFNKAWYRSQKEHWLGWLAEYDGPGAYGRSDAKRDARFVYNHIQCAQMLFWLSEALDTPSDILNTTFEAVVAAPNRGAQQCAALRSHLPWDQIADRLAARSYPLLARLRIKAARMRSQNGG
jgi:hypothetical protein